MLTTAYMISDSFSRIMGDWESARGYLERGLEITGRGIRIRTLETLLEFETGNFAGGQVALDHMLDTMRQAAPGPTAEYCYPAAVIPFVARITGELERLDMAKAAAETVLSYPSVVPLIGGTARLGLALIAVQLNDTTLAAEQYSAMRESPTISSMGFAPTLDRIYGLLAQTMGDSDRAANHFEDSVRICRKAGYRPELAWSCCDYADLLKERDAEGDRGKAVQLLDEALALSSELGMRPLMERVLSRREILKA